MGSGDHEDWAEVRKGPRREEFWSALAEGKQVPVGSAMARLSVVELGKLYLPSGEVDACDPFVGLGDGTGWMSVEPGAYPVKVTLADLSPAGDGSDFVEAYLTLVVDEEAEEVRREIVGGADWGGVGVDAGAVCFVDARAASLSVETFDDWEDLVTSPGGWGELLDDPAHVGPGCANVPLPGLDDGSNVVMCQSGWGDGIFPVVAGYDTRDRLVRLHIDLQVIREVMPPRDEHYREFVHPSARTRAYAVAITLGPAILHVIVSLAMGWSVEVTVFGAAIWVLIGHAISVWQGWGLGRGPF